MMLHATKRGFKDCPGFLKSTGRLGPKRGRKCYVTPAFSGVPNKGGHNQNPKPPLGVTMMLLVSKRGFKDCPVSSIAPEGWGPKEGGNATSPLHSRGSPTKGDTIRTQNLR